MKEMRSPSSSGTATVKHEFYYLRLKGEHQSDPAKILVYVYSDSDETVSRVRGRHDATVGKFSFFLNYQDTTKITDFYTNL